MQGPGRAAADDLGDQRRARGVRGDPGPLLAIEYPGKPAKALGGMPRHRRASNRTATRCPATRSPAMARLTAYPGPASDADMNIRLSYAPVSGAAPVTACRSACSIRRASSSPAAVPHHRRSRAAIHSLPQRRRTRRRGERATNLLLQAGSGHASVNGIRVGLSGRTRRTMRASRERSRHECSPGRSRTSSRTPLVGCGVGLRWPGAIRTSSLTYLCLVCGWIQTGANNALQAWDLLHGHVLLRRSSATTFYFFELPLIGIAKLLFGDGQPRLPCRHPR